MKDKLFHFLQVFVNVWLRLSRSGTVWVYAMILSHLDNRAHTNGKTCSKKGLYCRRNTHILVWHKLQPVSNWQMCKSAETGPHNDVISTITHLKPYKGILKSTALKVIIWGFDHVTFNLELPIKNYKMFFVIYLVVWWLRVGGFVDVGILGTVQIRCENMTSNKKSWNQLNNYCDVQLLY